MADTLAASPHDTEKLTDSLVEKARRIAPAEFTYKLAWFGHIRPFFIGIVPILRPRVPATQRHVATARARNRRTHRA